MSLRTGIVLAAAAALATAAWLAVETGKNRLVWDHFDVVKHGILYRSGQLNGDQLARAVKTIGIKTVVNFQIPGREVEAERALAKKLGVRFVNLPMPGDGFGKESQFREVLALTDDPESRPVLMHCARGTCRTGAAAALYRFERDGWALKDVSAEMERQAYRQGWLPGYVYGMLKEHPADQLLDAVAPKAAASQEAPHVR